MEEELVARILKLENELKSTKYLVIFLILMFIVLAYQYISVQRKNQLSVDLVRTRGLVIQDEKGRDFMLFGSPIPYSEQRKRADLREGFLMMDENGNDRLLVGKLGTLQRDGQLYERTDQGWGFLVNDRYGNERGGMGMLDSLNSMMLGLNYPGREGIMLVTEPDHAFMVIHADTREDHSERIVLDYKKNTKETSVIQLSARETGDRITLRTVGQEKPSLEYVKKDGSRNDLFQ